MKHSPAIKEFYSLRRTWKHLNILRLSESIRGEGCWLISTRDREERAHWNFIINYCCGVFGIMINPTTPSQCAIYYNALRRISLGDPDVRNTRPDILNTIRNTIRYTNMADIWWVIVGCKSRQAHWRMYAFSAGVFELEDASLLVNTSCFLCDVGRFQLQKIKIQNFSVSV